MRLRRFEAATVAEALARVRDDLGPDAVILHARGPELDTAAGRSAGRVEVMAAVDDDAGGRPAHGGHEDPGARVATLPRRSSGVADGPTRRGRPWTAPDDDPAAPETMEEMYRMLLELHDAATPTPRMSPGLQRVYRELCRGELPAAVARQVLSGLAARVRNSRGAPDRTAVRAALGAAFRVQGDVSSGTRRVVVLVGPTGVGKTTTIAKLAGQCRRMGGSAPALVSLDTYRIGATAQMQIYAELLGVPLHVVRTPSDLARAVGAESRADLVLVDSTGRSPHHQEGIAGLRSLLREVPDPEVHLVVSATTKGSDLEEILRRFRPLRYRHLLITKLDEARSVGAALGLALRHDLSISYLAAGQEVPDDLAPATAGRLAALLLPDAPGHRRSVPTRTRC
jgi:flagellar biosynthesis protein FlhF